MISEEYYKYLHGISWKGRLYRRFLIYPIIHKYCKGNVLDLGCGLGGFLDFSGCVGADINEYCIEYCRSLGHRAFLVQGNSLPFQDAEFDTVVMDNVLEHIQNPKSILEECYRALSDQGVLIIGVPGVKGFKKDLDHKIFYQRGNLYSTLIQYNFFPTIEFCLPFFGLSKYLGSYCEYYIFKKIVNA